MPGSAVQLTLDLDHRPALGRADFMVSESNRQAVAMIDAWRDWPGGRLALIGPARSGKTHLARVWMAETGAEHCAASGLTTRRAGQLAEHGRVVVEDADRLEQIANGPRRDAEDALFHLYNLLAASGGSLMVTGRRVPSLWATRTADLGSRLSAFPVATLQAPDDTLLSSVIVKLFADRQLHVEPEVIRFVIWRMDRSFEAAEDFVARLDALALRRKARISRSLAATVLEEMTATGSG